MSIARRNRAPLASPLALLLTGLIVIVTGLAVHFVVSGLTGDLVGGALYAVLVCLVVAFVAPRCNLVVMVKTPAGPTSR